MVYIYLYLRADSKKNHMSGLYIEQVTVKNGQNTENLVNCLIKGSRWSRCVGLDVLISKIYICLGVSHFFVTQYLLFLTSYSLFLTRYSLFITCYSLFLTRYSLILTRTSLFLTRYLLFLTHYSLFLTHYLLFLTRDSLFPSGYLFFSDSLHAFSK